MFIQEQLCWFYELDYDFVSLSYDLWMDAGLTFSKFRMEHRHSYLCCLVGA